MIRKFYLILVTSSFWIMKFYAQDPQFSQFYAVPLYMGPSFAGAAENTRFVVNFRDQWPKIPGSFITYAFSADHYISQYKSGIGILLLRDQAGGGKLNTTNIAAQYAYNIKIGNTWRVRPGLQFSYFQKSINYEDLIFSDQMDFDGNNPTSLEIPVNDKLSNYDFATSLLVYNQKIWGGATFDHLIKLNPAINENDNYSPMKYAVFGGVQLALEKLHYKKDQHSLFLSFHFRSQGNDKQLDFGTYYEKNGINLGIWYRGIPVFAKSPSHDALTLMIGYSLDGINIGYSYDMTISRLITHTGGAHEISISYVLPQNPLNRKRKIEPVPCPIL